MNRSAEHSALVKLTLKELTSQIKDARAFSRNVGSNTTTWVKFGTVGEADIMVLLAPRGRVLYLEAKTGKGVQRKSQKIFQSVVESYGAQYHVFHSVEEAINIVKNAER